MSQGNVRQANRSKKNASSIPLPFIPLPLEISRRGSNGASQPEHNCREQQHGDGYLENEATRQRVNAVQALHHEKTRVKRGTNQRRRKAKPMRHDGQPKVKNATERE